MNAKKQHISFWLARLPLLLLYISFFAVQLFYNFDIANHPEHIAGASFQKNAIGKNSHVIVKKGSLPNDKKTNFRLNKRYQPRDVVTCNSFIIKPLVCFVTSKLHVHYSNGFIPSSLPTARSLRGPPVVV